MTLPIPVRVAVCEVFSVSFDGTLFHGGYTYSSPLLFDTKLNTAEKLFPEVYLLRRIQKGIRQEKMRVPNTFLLLSPSYTVVLPQQRVERMKDLI